MKEQYIQTSLVTDDYISFKTECDCFAHDLHVTFEKNHEFNYISLSMEDKMFIEEQYNCGFFKGVWSRIKIACRILFKGYYEFNYEFCFKGQKHVDEFMKYMNEAYKEIKNEDTK